MVAVNDVGHQSARAMLIFDQEDGNNDSDDNGKVVEIWS